MQSEERDLRDRTKQFALRILEMFSVIPKTTEAQVLGKQVLRSGTSVGANYREAESCRVYREMRRFVARARGDRLLGGTARGRTLRPARETIVPAPRMR